ncbi:MAG TPA: fumarylacetoacetase, partial [Gemmatimonadales bacterium]|nr:fumarylacetoacetase [Gemmatimonadales bacterium]
MIAARDETHDPALRSWVESANRPGADFPIQNLPFGVFESGRGAPRIGVAIGDQILDLRASADAGLLDALPVAAEACRGSSLNLLMTLAPELRAGLRRLLSRALSAGARRSATTVLVPMSEARLLLPATVGDYTDFYASLFHATNVGSMFRPENPLLPNYKWVPIGYHGRASSVVVSGSPVRRPAGQARPPGAEGPAFGPSRQLDYELEIGAWIAGENALGESVPLAEAERRFFGLTLLNDWSARDIQSWEYQPLGPFLGKSFATTVSPWVVTAEALAPFRVPAFERAAEDPMPLPYLAGADDRRLGGISIELEVALLTARMREAKQPPCRLSHTNFRQMYWTLGQMITHHTSNGCNLRPGDLLGSGTISGPGREERGCLLELSWRGTEPLILPNGETRTFLADGDEVVMTGWCQAEGAVRIGTWPAMSWK